MSFKEELQKLGLAADVAESITKLHNESITNNYIPKNRFDEVNNDKAALTSELEDANNKLSELKGFEGTYEELKTKVAELETTSRQKEEDYKTSSQERERKFNVMLGLVNSKEFVPHDVEMVYSNLDKEMLVFDDKNQLKGGLDEASKKLFEEKAFLYVPQSTSEKSSEGGVYSSGWKPKGYSLQKGDPQPTEPTGGRDAKGFGRDLAREILRTRGIEVKGD